MRVYRLAKTQFVRDLQGTGGLYGSGRWHRRGTPILYTSENASLPMLEFLANYTILPDDLSLLTLDIPEGTGMEQVLPDQLPANWRNADYPPELANQAMEWIRQGESLLLKVPSVHSPVDCNILINPSHPDARLMTIVKVERYAFDQRIR
ncbi:MAG: RES family NAD+ phosphorylase [Ferruginibacter sp.]|nr:RES family NAD+ phosphorylase [Cytophagales bacterium]